jgi:hypothetical protein
MTRTQRGEPTLATVTDKLFEVWALVPEINFTHFMINVISCGGVNITDLAYKLPGLVMTDTQLIEALGEYKRILLRG